MNSLNIAAPAQVQKKWTTGRRAKLKLESISDRAVRSSTMIVLENIDKESAITSGNFLLEESTTIGSYGNPGSLGGGALQGPGAQAGTNSSMYHPVSMALARRVFPSLFAHKLVGVQPMNAPVGVAFGMRSVHNSTVTNDAMTPIADNEAAWKNVDKFAGFSGGYKAIDADSDQARASIWTVTVKDPTATSTDITLPIGLLTTASHATTAAKTSATVVNDLVTVGAVLTYLTADAAIKAATDAAIATARKLFAQVSQVGYPGTAETWDGTDAFNKELAAGISTRDSELLGVANINDKVYGDALSASNKINEIGVVFDKKLIEATERRLAASFSLQAMQDIKALHNLDLKMEVLEVLQYETTAELDRELLYALKSVSIDQANDGGNVLTVDVTDGGNSLNDNRQATALVVNAILLAANTVAKYAKRGRANFVVVSPTVGSILQSAVPFFTANEAKVDPGIVLSGSESTEIGKLNGVLTVYLDQFADTEYALVGYKGGNVAAYDSGVIFCPYTMNVVNEAISQENFQPRIGVMSRYAIATNLLSAGAYYRSIVFTGLDTVFGGSNWTGIKGW